MKCLVLVPKGLEEYAVDDIKEFDTSIKNIKISEPGILSFETDAKDYEIKDYEIICKYAYMTQIASRVLLEIYHEKNKLHIEKILSDCDISESIQSSITKNLLEIKDIIPRSRFRVSVMNQSDEVLDVQSLEKAFGILISDVIDGVTVDLKNPEVIFYVIITSEILNLALDFSGDLSKRDYRIFNSPMSIKGTTAYGLLRIAGYKKGELLLDPHCNSGTLAIETALYNNNISPKHYDKNMPFSKLNIFNDEQLEKFFKKIHDKYSDHTSVTAADPLLKNVTAAKKNAKVAGVEKLINFRRIDIDWMDIKHEKKQFDKIITFLPGSSKHRNDKQLEKGFKELFYQAEYILGDNGVMAILCLSKDLLIKTSNEHFKLHKQHQFYSGEQLMTVLLFKKK